MLGYMRTCDMVNKNSHQSWLPELIGLFLSTLSFLSLVLQYNVSIANLETDINVINTIRHVSTSVTCLI